MTEKQLIAKLEELRQIKPRKEWVGFAKNQILALAEEALTKGEGDLYVKHKRAGILSFLPILIYQRRLAYALVTTLLIMVGIFGFAQHTVPGDLLFSVRKITEQSKTSLEIAISRSDDLIRVAKDNRLQNLPSAINEFKASISQAAKNLSKEIVKKDSKTIKEIAIEVKKLQDNKKQLEVLGIDLSESQEAKELNNALAPLVQREIEELEKATLTEKQQKTLNEIKDLYLEGNFSEALEKILMINN